MHDYVELLKIPEKGIGGGTYDLKFLDQSGNIKINTNIKRKINGKTSNQKLYLQR